MAGRISKPPYNCLNVRRSDSTDVLTTFDSGYTLLNDSLPSACSSAWSADINPPPISEARHAHGSNAVDVPALPPKAVKMKQRRYTTCVSNHSHREALVLEQRLNNNEMVAKKDSSKKIVKDMMTQIDELSAFYNEGLKEMDSKMLHLGEEKEILVAPSLVVSTSTAVLPLSLGSSADLGPSSTPPLALRRGKYIPGTLKVDTSLLDSIDYPDIPTPFRGSPLAIDGQYTEKREYPTLALDMSLTAEEMIKSLRAQVECFEPRTPIIEVDFLKQFDDAEKWLGDELSSESQSDINCTVPEIGNPIIEDGHASIGTQYSDYSADVNSICINKVTSGRSRTSSNQADKGGIKLPSVNLKCWNARPSNIRTLSRKNDVHQGKIASEKKVRFSLHPPSTIPHDILDKVKPIHTVTADCAQIMKRKPPPVYSGAIRPPATRKMTYSEPPTIRAVTPRKRAKSFSSDPMQTKQTYHKLSPSLLRHRTSDNGLIPLSTTKSDEGSTLKVSRPKSLTKAIGKENKENKALKVAGITLGKRKSFDTLEVKESKKNGKTLGLPFQNMLNRFRG